MCLVPSLPSGLSLNITFQWSFPQSPYLKWSQVFLILLSCWCYFFHITFTIWHTVKYHLQLKGFYFYCSVLYPQCSKQYLAYCRYPKIFLERMTNFIQCQCSCMLRSRVREIIIKGMGKRNECERRSLPQSTFLFVLSWRPADKVYRSVKGWKGKLISSYMRQNHGIWFRLKVTFI